jgi:polar amino acid transport system substrate-binding protein
MYRDPSTPNGSGPTPGVASGPRRTLLLGAGLALAGCASGRTGSSGPGAASAGASAAASASPSAPARPRPPDPAALRELAPTGRLRAAIAVGPSGSTFRGTLDAPGGRPKGVPADLATAFGARIGLPVELVPYGNYPDLLDAGARGDWDVTFLPYDDARTRVIDYGPSYYDQSYTYLVRAGVPIARIADLDRAGIRLAVAEGSVTARNREGVIKAATIVRFRTLDQIREQLRTGTVDAAGAGRETLLGLAAQVPGSRVLDDAFLVERVAIGVPRGRRAALGVAAAFIEEAKRDGTVRRAFDAAGYKDAVVAAAASAAR